MQGAEAQRPHLYTADTIRVSQPEGQSPVAALCGAQRREDSGPCAQPPERKLDHPGT